MDPSRRGAGSSSQDELEALKRDELARERQLTQAQEASNRPKIPSCLPEGRTKEQGVVSRSVVYVVGRRTSEAAGEPHSADSAEG
jgi:hypothetical protein